MREFIIGHTHTIAYAAVDWEEEKVYTETSMIIRNGDPKLASECPSARGRRFTQPFTNNYALHSIFIDREKHTEQNLEKNSR